MSIIKYMGDDPQAEYNFKKHWQDDGMALYELSFMNAYRDKDPNTKAYKGSELIFRVNDCSDELFKKSEKALDFLENVYHDAIKEFNVAKYCTDSLIRSSMAMCCDVTPKEKDGKAVLDVSFKYINVNPYCPEELSENKTINGIPKSFEDKGNGFFQSPVKEFHIGYFPQCSLKLENLEVDNFKKNFINEYKKNAPVFQKELQVDFMMHGDTSPLPDRVCDGSFSMTALRNVTTYVASVIKKQWDDELEEKRSQVKELHFENGSVREVVKKR